MATIDLTRLSSAELEELLAKKREEENNARKQKKEAYESIRAEVVGKIRAKVLAVIDEVKGLSKFVQDETGAFYEVMSEYGELRREGQMSYTIQDGAFKVEVKSNKVKKFDERADIAAARLIEFLRDWIKDSSKGINDPMYQLAMSLLERNQNGDLDYKSVSKLYELEAEFGSKEYSAIMQLFKESNVVEGTATNYYFSQRNQHGMWVRLEPSFNRM